MLNRILKNYSVCVRDSDLLQLKVMLSLGTDICPDACPMVDSLRFLLPPDSLEGAGHDARLEVRRQ